MNFGFALANRKVKELRKNQGYTVKELAEHLRVEALEIKRIDECRLKEVPEPLRARLLPILRGDVADRMPWLNG
ncbi:MAG: transcriptional regulator [Bacteroidota bacterium]